MELPTRRWMVGGAAAVTLLFATVIGVGVPHHEAGQSHPARTGTDYAKDNDANVRVQLLADQLLANIADDSTFGGSRIVPSGLEISVVGTPSAALSSTIASLRVQVPVATRPVTHSWQHLEGLTTTMNGDQASWARAGVALSMWGPDYDSNKVKIWLAKYSPASEAALLQRYGTNEVVVDHESLQVTGSDQLSHGHRATAGPTARERPDRSDR